MSDARRAAVHPERLPGIRELAADFPLSEELHADLLEIPVGVSCEGDGETRAAELEALVGYELEPPSALLQRLRAIPANHARKGEPDVRAAGGTRRSTAFAARAGRRFTNSTSARGFGTGAAVAASYILAVALTLAVGDPVAAGRKAAENLGEAAGNLGAAAGERLLEPAADAGASMHESVTRMFQRPPAEATAPGAGRGWTGRLGALQELWQPSGLFTDPLDLPTDRVKAWFRSAVDSSAEAARGLGELWPWDASGDDAAPPLPTRNRTQTFQGGNSA